VIPSVPDYGVGPTPEPGTPHELAPGLVRLTAPNPGLMTGPGTNTYLVGTTELAVIDPGPDDASHREALRRVAAERGTIRFILVTHTHIDHAPGAAALKTATGAEVIGFGPAEQFEPDRCVGEGWTLALPGTPALTLRAVHTPGHASDHLCWLIEEHQTLLTGDHVMHGSTVVIRPPDGNLAQYRASLTRLVEFDPPLRQLAPGHGRVMEHIPDIVGALLAHRAGRHDRVAAALQEASTATVDELIPVVYDDVTEKQLPVARFSLWAHLRYLAQQGSAELLGEPTVDDEVAAGWQWVDRVDP
jgi:glyoxylase-like metal-dependent hydrolase (beta-lactamase superfamily II)